MVSVGIDVSKGKSTVCLMKPFGEIAAGPMEISHVDSELKVLVKLIKSMNDEAKVVMEATGVYHLPVLMLESGDFNHPESGEIRQSESSNKNQSPGLCLLH